MNIFFLDKEPQKIAEYHHDVHLRKMIIETAQMLCTAHHLHPLWDLPEKFYKKTHINHPSNIWARKCVANYFYLCEIGIYLCSEYSFRFGKTHASEEIIDWCNNNVPDLPIALNLIKFGTRNITSPALAMPNKYKQDCPVESYRQYYFHEKQYDKNGKWMMNYTNRDYPEWLSDSLIKQYNESLR